MWGVCVAVVVVVGGMEEGAEAVRVRGAAGGCTLTPSHPRTPARQRTPPPHHHPTPTHLHQSLAAPAGSPRSGTGSPGGAAWRAARRPAPPAMQARQGREGREGGRRVDKRVGEKGAVRERWRREALQAAQPVAAWSSAHRPTVSSHTSHGRVGVQGAACPSRRSAHLLAAQQAQHGQQPGEAAQVQAWGGVMGWGDEKEGGLCWCAAASAEDEVK